MRARERRRPATARAGAAAAALAAGCLAAPAHAAGEGVAFALLATGIARPGIPTTGCWSWNAVTVAGTLAVAGAAPEDYALTFHGQSPTCASMLSDQASGTLSGGVSGILSYSRTATFATLHGLVTIAGSRYLAVGWCAWTPTSLNPVDTFALECAGTLAPDG